MVKCVMPHRLILSLSALALALAACTPGGQSSGPVAVSVIGDPGQLRAPADNAMSAAGKLALETTARGLVSFDASGEITPALAQRWIVEDDGRSYIFRLRRARWADGDPVTAADVAARLRERVASNLRLDPMGDLSSITDIVAMTGEVVELRLSSPRPSLLQYLAQPQMGLFRKTGGSGPFRRSWSGKAMLLTPLVDVLPDPDDGPSAPLPAGAKRFVRAESGAMAVARFALGHSTLVLGGRYQDFPLLAASGVDRSAVRVDPVQGLFGLAVTGDTPLLQDVAVREALSMAIDRDRLAGQFRIGNWAATASIVPQQLAMSRAAAQPRWMSLTPSDRRAFARTAVAKWVAANGPAPTLRIALPPGTGSRLLFILIANDLRSIGLSAQMVAPNAPADLVLIDEVAAYDSPFWYLGRIGCSRGILCSADAEARLREAAAEPDRDIRAQKLAEAEVLALGFGGFIPIATPLRWSLVSRQLTGFTSNARARHPLNELVRDPT